MTIHFIRHSTHRFILGAMLVASLRPISASAATQDNAKRPNVVIIVSDDHGLDALGCYGNSVVQTPNLDSLARDGIRFSSAYCTASSCSPSRSAILTGLQGHHNGMYGLEHTFHHFKSFDNIKSLPVILEQAGYRTARVGKYHLGPDSVYRFNQVLSPGAANEPRSIGRSPVEMAELAEPVIADRNGQPFFLYFATDDPHRMNEQLPDGRIQFETWPAPNTFGNRPQGYPGIHEKTYTKEQVLVPAYLSDTDASRAELTQYYQAVSRLDQGVGRLIQILKDSGRYDDTLIIYISDNGAAFPGAKTTLYEPGVHLPCIIKPPGFTGPGRVDDTLISWVDLVPTILETAAVTFKPDNFDGNSFASRFSGTVAASPENRTIFFSHTFHEVTMYYPMRAVRTQRYKLIHNLASTQDFPMAADLGFSSAWISFIKSGTGMIGKRTIRQFLTRPEYELYDLQSDPEELHNLAGSPDLKEVEAKLKAEIVAFRRRTSDPWLEQ